MTRAYIINPLVAGSDPGVTIPHTPPHAAGTVIGGRGVTAVIAVRTAVVAVRDISSRDCAADEGAGDEAAGSIAPATAAPAAAPARFRRTRRCHCGRGESCYHNKSSQKLFHDITSRRGFYPHFKPPHRTLSSHFLVNAD